METIAVYWEERVKVYSINEKSGLALGRFQVPTTLLSEFGEQICLLEKSVGRFELVTANPQTADTTAYVDFHLVIGAAQADILLSSLNPYLIQNPKLKFDLKKPVEMLYLHGPHFQDRYGIADLAFTAFAENGCELYLCGCAGTSMYLVLPQGQVTTGKKILSGKFILPTTS